MAPLARSLVAIGLLASGCGFLVDAGGLSGGPSGAGSEGDAAAPEGGGADAGPGVDGSTPSVDGGANPDAPITPDDGAATLTDGGAGGADGGTVRAYQAAVLADHPLLYLPLGDSVGATSVKNLGSLAVTPTVTGSPVFGKPGAIANDTDTAVSFAAGALNCGDILNFSGQQPYTIELWLKPPTVPSGAQRFLVRKGDWLADGGSGPEAYTLYFINPGGGQNAVFSRRSGGSSRTTDLVFPYTDAGFYHVVAIHEGQLTMYKNGNLFASDVDGNTAGSILGPLIVGGRAAGGPFADTEIDEIAIYDYALPSARVVAHYKIGSGQ